MYGYSPQMMQRADMERKRRMQGLAGLGQNQMAYQNANQNAMFQRPQPMNRNQYMAMGQNRQPQMNQSRPQQSQYGQMSPMNQSQYMQRSGAQSQMGGYDLPPMDRNPYSPTGGQGFNLDNMYRRKRPTYF